MKTENKENAARNARIHVATYQTLGLDDETPNAKTASFLTEHYANESAFVETKRKLVDDCDVWAIISLPGGVFSTAGAGVKTNLLFFTKGRKTETIWYYDLSHVKVGKKTPMTLAHFGFDKYGNTLKNSKLPNTLTADWLADEATSKLPYPSYARMLATKGESCYSWSVDFAARRADVRRAA